MSNEIKIVFMVAFALFAMQAIGGWFQIQNYKKTIRRMHKLGNVGIGQTKGRFLSGNLVLIACDSKGKITGAAKMEGLTFLTKFKPFYQFLGNEIEGKNISFFIDLFESYDKKTCKKNKGFIQAIEALDLRINHPEQLENSEEKNDLTIENTAEIAG